MTFVVFENPGILSTPGWLYLVSCLFSYPCTYTSGYLSVYLAIYLPKDLSIYLALYLSICLSIYLSVYLSIDLSIYLPVYLSIYLCMYLSICLSVCLYVYVCLHLTSKKPCSASLRSFLEDSGVRSQGACKEEDAILGPNVCINIRILIWYSVFGIE